MWPTFQLRRSWRSMLREKSFGGARRSDTELGERQVDRPEWTLNHDHRQVDLRGRRDHRICPLEEHPRHRPRATPDAQRFHSEDRLLELRSHSDASEHEIAAAIQIGEWRGEKSA